MRKEKLSKKKTSYAEFGISAHACIHASVMRYPSGSYNMLIIHKFVSEVFMTV